MVSFLFAIFPQRLAKATETNLNASAKSIPNAFHAMIPILVVCGVRHSSMAPATSSRSMTVTSCVPALQYAKT